MVGFRRGLLLLALVVAACGIDKADIGADTPPLIRRDEGTTPADSAQNLYDADGLDLVINFNRPFEAGEVSHLQLVPRPPGLGVIENPAANPRQIVLRDVVLAPAFPTYVVVMDGPSMRAPELITYFSGVPSAFDGGIQGHVFISRGITQPADALVYALVPLGRDGEFALTGAEDRIFGRPVLGVSKTLVVATEEGGWYALTGLQNYRRYLVFAILDTSRDGIYDLEVDWWGFYADASGIPLEVMAGVTLGSLLDPPLPDKRIDVDFPLYAPGTFDPWLD